jgi:hypothetical protein
MMLGIATIWLLCLGAFLDLCDGAPIMDDAGSHHQPHAH